MRFVVLTGLDHSVPGLVLMQFPDDRLGDISDLYAVVLRAEYFGRTRSLP